MHMLDILILLILAIFFISRLRKVLGTKIDDNYKKPDNRRSAQQGQVVNLRGDMPHAAAVDAAVHQVEDDAPLLADIDDPDVSKGLADIKAVDSEFNVREFLGGAKMAFEMILEAYNNGDTVTLRDLLGKEVYEDFTAALAEREAAERFEQSTLVAIESATITRARLEGRKAEVTVTFVSEQITVERDAEGNITGGDASTPELVTDEWTFQRDIRSNNPNWLLVNT